jgi:beta-phosphoglucomutase-like phosphatase (HAD superfamily)
MSAAPPRSRIRRRWPRAATAPSPRTPPPPRPAQAAAPSTGAGPVALDGLASRWQQALDAADRGLRAAAGSLPAAELAARRRVLAEERAETEALLVGLARVGGAHPLPWLSPVPVTPAMLGLAATVEACVFDLDGVLTDSGALHARAWHEVFGDLRHRLAERTGWQFMPFDPARDYAEYIDGRPRLEGVHLFLASRGVRLPEGRPDDPADALTACGLARRKGDLVARGLGRDGVAALTGVRRYLEAVGHAGLRRGVVSASTSTMPMLERAGLATLVEERVDADVMQADGLRSRPAPDLLLGICRRLGVAPERAVTLTHSPAGVAAGHAAGMAVVGVGRGTHAEVLAGFGAERVVPSVHSLLDARLATP